jgi:hypothetical protein
MKNFLAMKPKHIAVTAAIVWLASLGLPAIYLYRGSYSGWMIFLLGWMSGNYAWFANLFFGYALFRVIVSAKSPPVVSIFIAAIISLDTFTATKFLVDEGGGTSGVFGYGFGALLWFISICLMWIATAQRAIELATNSGNRYIGSSKLFLGLGVGLVLIVLVGSIGFAVADRIGATPLEKERLSNVVFKRGSVCKMGDHQPLSPPYSVNKILSVTGSVVGWNYAFWDSPLDFLKWGIPVVRVADTDYFYMHGKDNGKIVATPSNSEVTPRLSVGVFGHEIKAELTTPEHGGTVFSYAWNIRDDSPACPEWSYSNPPRKLILSSLALSEETLQQLPKTRPNAEDEGAYRQIPEIENRQSYDVLSIRCSKNVLLLDNFRKGHPESEPLGAALQVGDTIHFLPGLQYWYGSAICSGKSTYLVNITEGTFDDGIHIRKVSNDDPKIVWHLHAPLPRELLMKSVHVVEENDGLLTVVLEKNPKREGNAVHGVVVLKIPIPLGKVQFGGV